MTLIQLLHVAAATVDLIGGQDMLAEEGRVSFD